MSGAYIIKNLNNEMVYIGSSIDIEYRLAEHFRLLEEGTHYNRPMQNDYFKDKKYFVWGIYQTVERYEHRDVAYVIEQDLLDKYPHRYNILMNAKDHLLNDLIKREKSRQMKINFI